MAPEQARIDALKFGCEPRGSLFLSIGSKKNLEQKCLVVPTHRPKDLVSF